MPDIDPFVRFIASTPFPPFPLATSLLRATR